MFFVLTVKFRDVPANNVIFTAIIIKLRAHRAVGIHSHFSRTESKVASELKLSQHKAGKVVNMQTKHQCSSSHCRRCTLAKSIPANYIHQ